MNGCWRTEVFDRYLGLMVALEEALISDPGTLIFDTEQILGLKDFDHLTSDGEFLVSVKKHVDDGWARMKEIIGLSVPSLTGTPLHLDSLVLRGFSRLCKGDEKMLQRAVQSRMDFCFLMSTLVYIYMRLRIELSVRLVHYLSETFIRAISSVVETGLRPATRNLQPPRSHHPLHFVHHLHIVGTPTRADRWCTGNNGLDSQDGESRAQCHTRGCRRRS
jgi:hypothetical protein